MKYLKPPIKVPDAIYISIPEAAELTRLSEVSIRRYLTKKILVRYKAMGRTLLRRDDVLAMIKKA